MTFPIHLNVCVGEEHENETQCDMCPNYGTVVEFAAGKDRLFVCKYCLEKAIVDIHRALDGRRGKSPPYEKLETMKLPFKKSKKEKTDGT